MQAIVDAFTFGLAVRRGDRIWYNAALARFIQRPVGQLVTTEQWFSELYAEDSAKVRTLYEAHRAAGFPDPALITLTVPNGGVRHLSFNGSHVGPLEFWVVADVTEEKAAAQRYEELFERSSNPHFIFANGGVEECNQAALDVLGFESKEEFLSAHPSEFSPELQPCGTPSREKSKQVDKVAFETGFNSFYWIHKKKDGTLIPVQVSLTLVHLASGPALLGVWHDLSEREARENELRQARDQAEAGLASRSAFIATVSHELRTPMNGVLGLTEALLDTELTAEQREMTHAAHLSGSVLRRLLDDILDFSKSEAGSLRLEKIEFSLATTLAHVVELHQESARSKGVEITLDAADINVVGDPTRLGQIVGNLVSNGVKFTNDGEVRVTAGHAPGGKLLIGVEDTGIGMTEEQRARAFDAFQQADESTTRRFGGSGLGLAIVDRLVKAMGGSISCESRPGEGTRFDLTLPLSIVANEPEERTTTPSCVLPSGIRVLVAEDNAVNQLVVRRALQECELRFVENGSQVSDAVDAFAPEIILMDVHMPEMDGLEATRRLRQRAIDTPIIAFTASVLEEDHAACFSAGMDGILHKPLDRQALCMSIAQHLKSEASHERHWMRTN